LINDIKGYNLCEQSFTGRTHAKHPRCRLHCGLIGRSGPATTVAGHRQSKPGPPVCRRICFSQTERALEANVTAEWEAFKKKDKKTYSDLLADDFVAVEDDNQGMRKKSAAAAEVDSSVVSNYRLFALNVMPLNSMQPWLPTN